MYRPNLYLYIQSDNFSYISFFFNFKKFHLILYYFFRYHLKGSKKGEVEVFLNLPGFPDNIRLTPHDTLLVSFAAVRQPHRSIRSLMDFLGEYPMIRAILASVSFFT